MTSSAITMDNPELLLAGLNRTLLQLHGVVSARASGARAKQTLDRLRAALRTTITLETLARLNAIAVAGSQGAGKTTLVQTLYGLGDVLQPNAGLGEQLPVFIVERAQVKQPARWLHRLQAERMSRVEAGEAEWRAALSGSDPTIVMAEMAVPRRYFENEDTGFVLLPGYETLSATDSNRLSQELMRQSLVSSMAAVVVTDRRRLADEHQLQILSDIQQYVGEPVIAISKSAGMTEGLKGEARETACSVFKVHEANVVFTDVNNLHEWIDQFRRAVDERGGMTVGTRNRRLQLLKKTLDELGELEGDIALLVSGMDISSGEDLELWASYIRAYDEGAKAFRRTLSKGLSKSLSEHAVEATKRAKESYGRSEGGTWNALKGFFQNETKKNLARQRRLESAWDGRSLNALLARNIEGAIKANLDPDLLPASGRPQLPARVPELDPSTDAPATILALNGQATKQLELLITASKEEPDQLQVAVVRALPLVAAEILRIDLRFKEVAPQTSAGGSVDLPNGEQVVKFVTQQRALALGLMALLGVDIAIDGNIDLMQAPLPLIQAALAELGLPAVWAAPLMAAIVGAAGAVLVVSAVQRSDRRNLNEIELTIAAVKDATFASIMDDFDEIIAIGREGLGRLGEKRFHVDARTQAAVWASSLLADAREQRVSLQRITRSSVAGLD